MILSARVRITAVWLLLVIATLVSWESAQAGGDHRLTTSAVLFIAFVKVRFIGLDFMELRGAPRPLRTIFELWLLIVCAALLVLYWMSPAAP
jgi:hypothetical protein